MQPSTSKIQRVTVNIPKDLLQNAQEVTKKGITETLVDGLTILCKRKAYQRALSLKGKIHLDIDIDEARGRRDR